MTGQEGRPLQPGSDEEPSAQSAATGALPVVADGPGPDPAPGPSHCLFRVGARARVCRGYAAPMPALERSHDCGGEGGLQSEGQCPLGEVGLCAHAQWVESVHDAGGGCAEGASYCASMGGEWSCLVDDGQTPGNDRRGIVSCGETSACDLGVQQCCIETYSSEGVRCIDGDRCAQGSYPLACDGPEDCTTGQACCVKVSARDSLFPNSAEGQCLPEAQCNYRIKLIPPPIEIELRVCHRDEDCPAARRCIPDDTFPWWGYCMD